MTPEEIKQLIRDEIQAQRESDQMSTLSVPYHNHNGIDAPQIDGKNLLNAPQAAVTGAIGGAVNSGDATTDLIIANNTTRITQIVTILKNLGLTK
jgi:hypothetical protein